LGHNVYDPTVEEFEILPPESAGNFRDLKTTDLPAFRRIVRKLIDHDLEILTSEIDYVICLWDHYVKEGAGTQGEVTLAYLYEIPVYLVSELPVHQISGWILGCSSQVFTSFDELKKLLRGKYSDGG